MMSSISAIRPSMKPWRSRAEVYSAFSERSPCSRAAAIALMIAGRSTLFSCFSSSVRLFSPSAVVGTLSIAQSSSMNRAASTPNAPRIRVASRKLRSWRLESGLEVGLQGRHVEGPLAQRRNAFDRRLGAGDRGVIGDLVHQPAPPQRIPAAPPPPPPAALAPHLHPPPL